MTQKTRALRTAEINLGNAERRIANLLSLTEKQGDHVQMVKDESGRKDAIIDHIRESELLHIASLEKTNARIEELEIENTKIKLDEVMCGWALKQCQLQLQRALGWIDHADDKAVGQTASPAPEAPDVEN